MFGFNITHTFITWNFFNSLFLFPHSKFSYLNNPFSSVQVRQQIEEELGGTGQRIPLTQVAEVVDRITKSKFLLLQPELQAHIEKLKCSTNIGPSSDYFL